MAAQLTLLSPVAAPLYPSMDFYPTSPIQIFPPPLPTRPCLRSRCGVTMRLQLSTLGLTAPATGWSPKGHVQPHRNNLPRRRNIKRVVLHDNEQDEVDAKAIETKSTAEVEYPKAQAQVAKAASPVHVQPHRTNLPRRRKVRHFVVHDTDDDVVEATEAKPALTLNVERVKAPVAASHPPIQSPFVPSIPINESNLQILVPGISMTFADITTTLEQLPGHSSAEPYTHIVSIGYKDGDGPAIKRAYEGRAQRLHLYLSSSADTTRATRAGLGLTDAQLRTARDFMAEALPHLSMKDSQSRVRLLITGPNGRPTDIVCVAACYFAFVTGKTMEDVLHFIDAEDEILSVWKGEVSEDEAEKVEKIARAWSWLSNIIGSGIRA